MKYEIIPSNMYIDSYANLSKKDQDKVDVFVNMLESGTPIPPNKYKHKLKGNLKTYKSIHVRGDLVLVYQNIDNNTIKLVNVGTHGSGTYKNIKESDEMSNKMKFVFKEV